LNESPRPPGGTGERPSRLRSVIGWLAVGAIFFFIARSLVRNWDQLAAADLHFDIWLLLGSFVLLGLWMVAQAAIWHLLTVSNGAHIPLPKAMAAWFYSQLGKYVPGKVFLYLGRVHLYTREGRGAGPITVAFGVEFVGNLAAAVLTVLLAAITSEVPALDDYRWLLLIALVAFLIALHPRFMGWAIKLAARALRRQPFQIDLSYRQILGYVFLYFVNWLLFGVALYVFIRSFYSLELSSILYLSGAFSLSSVIGILALFAPSGLGVREGILAIFLNQVMPTSVALVVSVASRLWITVADLAAAGIVYVFVRPGRSGGEIVSGTDRTPALDAGLEDDE
jgi:uncharacterized membrane protein YbhN (UPF0104 family)